MKYAVLFSIILSSALFSQNQTKFNHSLFDAVLQKYVSNGLVDYHSLKNNKTDLDTYLTQLEKVNPSDFENWSREEKMAFWINAYNALTIEGILRNYPIQYGGLFARMRFPKSSIRQIKGFWDTVFIKVMGKDITLNDIEHKILRPEFKDPRVHFVLVCASAGCPTLENRAFFADDLDRRLDRAATNFVHNPEKVRLDKEKKRFYISSIFDWYKGDFQPKENAAVRLKGYPKKLFGVVDFLLKNLSPDQQQFILVNKPKIEFLDYSWALNEKK